MLEYKEYEKAVFDWLIDKNKKEGFTFSFRQVASKGAESDYFIGTKTSKYFSTTFWTIPVGYAGSAGDLIQLQFKYSPDQLDYMYFFELTQTNTPDSDQNRSALHLIKSLKVPLSKKFKIYSESKEDARVFSYKVASIAPKYGSIDFMLHDVNDQLKVFIDIINSGIESEKKLNASFQAERISIEQFNISLHKALVRIEKHKSIIQAIEPEIEEIIDEKKSIGIPVNQILYGPPGTGKTYHTINKAVAIANPTFDLNQDREVIKAEYQRLVDEGKVVFTTFHQSMSYEDFVEGIKPLIDEDKDGNKQVVYEVKDGIFKEIAKAAYDEKQGEKDNNYVIIIDEINRGNVSAIFGELITLIEESKREGMEEALEVILPYSKEKFTVPANLYIIGTMNTADRSVEALDTALRRRFVFEEMLPKPEILDHVLFGYPASAILKRINQRIEILMDRDHCIGHAYFIGKNEDSMVDSFYKNIIPLLQEYFFGDYGKMGLVLGKGFVRLKKAEKNIFADFNYDYIDDLESKPIYEIIDYRNMDADIVSFKEAIQSLMC